MRPTRRRKASWRFAEFSGRRRVGLTVNHYRGLVIRFQGRITDWRDEKGFGFITPNGGGERVFVHIKSLPRSTRRPESNDQVNYTVERDQQGRLRASNVAFVTRQRGPQSKSSAKSALLTVVVFFGVLVAVLVAAAKLPIVVAITYIIASAITFCAYTLDKAAARADRWRTQESTLHLFGLLGGWPGGLVAQQILRHKSQKESFLLIFWFTVAANIAGLIWLMSADGQAFIEKFSGG